MSEGEEEEDIRDRNFLRVARHKWMVSKHVFQRSEEHTSELQSP